DVNIQYRDAGVPDIEVPSVLSRAMGGGQDGLQECLFIAISKRDSRWMKRLVACQADPGQPFTDPEQHFTATPLHLTVDERFVEGLKTLCESRADVNRALEGCSSPFWSMLEDFPEERPWSPSDRECLQVLIMARAKINDFNFQQHTPLTFIASEAIDDGDSCKILQILLEGNADPDRFDQDGFSALHYAVKYGHQQMTRRLIHNRATVDIAVGQPTRYFGKTALTFAIEQSDTPLVSTLLQLFADVQKALEWSTLPLWQAMVGPRYEEVRQLLQDAHRLAMISGSEEDRVARQQREEFQNAEGPIAALQPAVAMRMPAICVDTSLVHVDVTKVQVSVTYDPCD
ncbi:ankrd29, partial [Symbiodinium sp. CCMP2456]